MTCELKMRFFLTLAGSGTKTNNTDTFNSEAVLYASFTMQNALSLDVLFRDGADGRCLTVTWGPGCDGSLSGSTRLFWMDSLRSRLVWGSVASRWLGGLAAVVAAGTGLAASPVERALLWFAFLGPGRRRPHLHDGINHTAVSLRCRSTAVAD